MTRLVRVFGYVALSFALPPTLALWIAALGFVSWLAE